MTKKEMAERIDALEHRITMLEARPAYSPYHQWIPPYVSPPWLTTWCTTTGVTA
jgi:hypothetical protein